MDDRKMEAMDESMANLSLLHKSVNRESLRRLNESQCEISPFGPHLRESIRRPSESQSEISSIGTEFSANTIALKLGISPEEIDYFKFKIDRQKLLNMLQSETEDGINEAMKYFDDIMEKTRTCITWPYKLKVDAKSKKDPSVKISGRKEDIQVARDLVLKQLEGMRVVMKVDISYTDHSYIIGKSGDNIKKIMSATKTHIHFPDSNQSNEKKKSNQVSLCGSVEGVEKARYLVRASSPLVFSFHLTHHERPQLSNTQEYISDIQKKFQIEVKFTSRHPTLVMVKGKESEYTKVIEATTLLFNYMHGDELTGEVFVNSHMEISTNHHGAVKGEHCGNLKNIMELTKTEIIFCDLSDSNIREIKKSQVTIKGNIHGVYQARQQLIGSLPITLTFDYQEYNNDLNELKMKVAALGNKYRVSVVPKPKCRTNTVLITGMEKYVGKIYEARHELLKLSTPLVTAVIPPSYYPQYDQNRKNFFVNPDSPTTPTPGQFGNYFQFNQYPYINPCSSILSSHNFRQRNVINPINRYSPTHSLMQSLPSYSPKSNTTTTTTSDYHSSSFNSNNSSIDQLNHAFLQQNTRFANKESCNNSFDNSSSLGLDVENAFSFDQSKRLEGFKAMRRNIDLDDSNPVFRTPTSSWSGLGISRTSPFQLDKSNNWDRNSPYNLEKTTGIVDGTPSNSRKTLSQHTDIQSLLTELGLEHYINTFVVHEIDMEVFSTLTAANLTEMGIHAFGARKKILLAVSQIAASKLPSKYSGSVAPGAERRISGDW